MIEPRDLTDAAARRRALDPGRCCIVQAPAGSGKTELLIQRFLTLLARVEAPEEIVAITFTRKAAGEMRERVLGALSEAARDAPPESDYGRATWALARAARQRDAQRGWDVSASPGRLRIQTIDALCAALTRQMPVLSGFGAQAEPVEDAAPLYLEAARRTLLHLDHGHVSAAGVARVLAHLDNNVEHAETLIADMLARRDQWLRHVADPDSRRIRRETLEASLANVIVDALQAVRRLTPQALEQEIVALAAYAAANLTRSGSESPIITLVDLTSLPQTARGSVEQWCGIAALLLTSEGGLRKKVSADIGFPAPSAEKDKAEQARRKQYKNRCEVLLAELVRHPEFVDALRLTRSLPPAAYSASQWDVVEALTTLLPLAVAELELLFRERAQVDFSAVAQAAVRALGDADEPTDLALALDYRICHLLVDEFQDTSLSQFELLERLTAGWQPGDGRTLFVVGDPMQSIYRFREAQVGLFLRAWHRGIGALSLEPLTLRLNFRSQDGLVRWVNESFRIILPEVEDLGSGAVPFSASHGVLAELAGRAVSVHPLLHKDRAAEARIVVDLVQRARAEDPRQRVAILVRSRGHLSAIVPALNDAGLRFQAIEIEQLGHLSVVQDLYALTRALLHAADRTAWLSVLRAPWCGLTLADLDALAGHDHDACIWDLMRQQACIERLTPDGRQRVTSLRERLRPCLAQRQREPLRRWVEGAWLAIGGPACAGDAAELEDAQVFLSVLGELEVGGDLPELEALAARLSQLYALPDPRADETLQVMTIHKAKGLEFDTVVLPGLGHPPRPKEPRLLLWAERPRTSGPADLLLAPIRERAQVDDRIYGYVSVLEDAREEQEDGRLLYVAATRAKLRLHLIGHVEVRHGEPRPSPRSLLARLWPAVEPAYRQALDAAAWSPADEATLPIPDSTIRRFPSHWRPPAPPPAILQPEAWTDTGSTPPHVEFSWASESARHVGTVVHRMLQRIAEDGLARWNVQRIASMREVYARDLRALGVPEARLESAVEGVAAALAAALCDERARWVLAPHSQARSELRLTGELGGKLIDIAIDRTFVDDQGIRWIVDYKTGSHEGADLEQFLDNERERYREQLERYAALLSRLESRPTRLALYFPLVNGWRQWEAAAPSHP